jgi:hypothetical protein
MVKLKGYKGLPKKIFHMTNIFIASLNTINIDRGAARILGGYGVTLTFNNGLWCHPMVKLKGYKGLPKSHWCPVTP